MNITYDQLVQTINDASAVIVDFDALTFPYIDEDERYIELSWDSPDGFTQHYIYESDIKDITFNNEHNWYSVNFDNGRCIIIQPLVVGSHHF